MWMLAVILTCGTTTLLTSCSSTSDNPANPDSEKIKATDYSNKANWLHTNKAKTISNQWKPGLQGILDAYLGKTPESFTYQGQQYTPKTFAASLGLDWTDYATSFSCVTFPARIT